MYAKKRLHFGVMFATIENANQYEIWHGVESFAEEHDINLTAYVGSYQDADDSTSTFFETCFKTVCDSSFLDGMIVFSGFVAQNAGFDDFSRHMRKIPKDFPVVSVSLALPGVPSVLSENTNGVYNSVEHLIRTHGKRKIAFVRGPQGHPEAEERLAGYKKALEENKIPFDERYVLPGIFLKRSGEKAVRKLIEQNLPFDAIVASNDLMAVGVMEELRKQNILVPEKVSVTGFDDDYASASHIPSLSTVRQNFYKIGTVSADTLLKKINGEQVDYVTHVTPFFAVRQSCGCLDNELTESLIDTNTFTDLYNSSVLESFISLFKNVPKAQVEEWANVLVKAIKQKPFEKTDFLYLFNGILIKHIHYYKDLKLWLDALSILTMSVELNSDEYESAHTILSTLVSATAFVQDIRFKQERNKELDLTNIREFIRRFSSSLVITFDMDTMAEKIFTFFPSLNMNTALVGVYRNPIKREDPDADRHIETLVGFDGGRKFNYQHNRWNPILCSDYPNLDGFDMERERRSLFCIPLYFDEDELGVIFMPYNPLLPADAYETLRVSVSTAVKGSELLSTIRTLSITDELTGLLNRRGFFQFVYARILHMSRNNGVVPMVMFMDMDGLKTINDTYGHNEGDVAISAFAGILTDALRKDDIIGRVGGDEFVVFSSVKASENSEQVVQRIRDKLDEYNSKKRHPYLVSSSIGSVVLDEISKECFEEAMLSADNVLYEEKMAKKKKGLSRQ